MTAPLVSVVIPVYNGGDAFQQCLQALSACQPPAHEVLIVDDGSTDGSADLAQAHGYRVLRTDQPRSGPAAARNLGAMAASGDVLFFVDADVVVRPDAIDRVTRALAVDPDLAALFGSYDDAPAAPNFLSQYKNLFHHYVHQHSSEEAASFWSGCGAMRRAIFLVHGGFDTRRYHRPCIEDIDLGYRVSRSGGRIRLLKDLQVKHLKRWTVRSLLGSDILDRGIPWTQLLLRERAFANDLNLQTHNRLSVVAVYLLALSLMSGLTLVLARPSASLWPWLSVAAFGALLLALNWPLYRWFARVRGAPFALAVIPWHWLYYLYNGLSFTAGLALHLLSRPESEDEAATASATAALEHPPAATTARRPANSTTGKQVAHARAPGNEA